MKPIEKGCQAIIISTKPRWSGKSVTITHYVGRIKADHRKNHWGIGLYDKAGLELVADESQLMRIDGHKQEEMETLEWSDE